MSTVQIPRPVVERVEYLKSRWYREVGEENPANYYASVTNILSVAQPQQLVDYYKKTSYKKQTATLEQAVGLGQHIHDLIESDLRTHGVMKMDLKWKLGEETIDLTDWFSRWQKLRLEHHIEGEQFELAVVNKKHGYAGTADIIGRMNGKPTLFDLKSGHYSTKIGWQLAAYREAYKEMTGEELGMVWLSVPWNKEMKLFSYEHLDWCFDRFLDSLGVWKGLYYGQLDKMGWRFLHVDRNGET